MNGLDRMVKNSKVYTKKDSGLDSQYCFDNNVFMWIYVHEIYSHCINIT